MQTQNTSRQLVNSYGLSCRPQFPGKAMIKNWLKSVLGIYAIEETKQMRARIEKDIKEINHLLTLNGEEGWFLNMCRKPKNREKECLPNDKD